MKNLIIILILTFSTSLLKAQVFDGVPVSGNIETFVNKMKEKKYTIVKESELGAVMNGYLAGQSVELFIGSTPKTRQVNRLTLYFTEWNEWTKLKYEYDNILSVFTDKYGKPDDKYNQFLSPYGDAGTEMTAVENDKALFQCYWWKKDGANLAVSISKYKQVKIVYENIKNTELYDTEEESIKKIKF
jgi:hypothetical protein